MGSFYNWYLYQNRVVPVPPIQRPNGTGTIQSGTGTTHRTKLVPVLRQSDTGTNFQNMISTGTNPSGIGTTASYNPDFGIHALLSSNLHTEGIGTLRND